MSPEFSVTHHPAKGEEKGSFDLKRARKRVGYLSYSLTAPHTMAVHYVQVDPDLQGAGLGRRLVAAAVEWARAHRHHIVPLCGYARAVLTRSAEYRDVLK